MGMFDRIKVRANILPFPKKMGELSLADFENEEWQTKSFDKHLDDYIIYQTKGITKINKAVIEYHNLTQKEIREHRNFIWEIFGKTAKDQGKKKVITNIPSKKKCELCKKFNFYTLVEKEKHNYWIEFESKVNNGLIEYIKLTRFEERNK